MNQRKPGNGMQNAADGSHLPCRTVADSRYKKIGEGKFRVSLLLTIQGAILTVSAVVVGLSKFNGEAPDSLSLCYSVMYLISMFMGRLGLDHSRTNLLKQYLFVSSVAALTSVISLLKREKSIGILKDLNEWGASKFEVFEIVAILLALLFQIFAVGEAVSLIHNMTPTCHHCGTTFNAD